MKKYIYNLLALTFITSIVIFMGCSESSQIDSDDIRSNIQEPQISTFNPSNGGPGTEIMLTGTNLANVDSVYIGGEIAKIKNRISNTQILIEVTANSKSGKITIKNPKGTYESNDVFDVNILKPEITDIKTEVSGELLVGEEFIINGKNLLSVKKAQIAQSDAKIVFASKNELRVIVPFIQGGIKSTVVLTYADGTEDNSLESTERFLIRSTILAPIVTEAPTTGLIGDIITIKGSNLTVVSSILIANKSISLSSKTETEIKFILPTTFIQETKADLILVYNESEQKVAVKDFIVTVPSISNEILFYPEVTLEAEGGASQKYFFNPENGNVHTACDYQNVKNNIYFYILSYTADKTIQLNNPNNNTTQAPRFSCDGVPLPAEAMPNIVKYRVLKATTSKEKVYIDLVKNKTIGKIDPQIIKDAGISNASTSTPRFGDNATFKIGDVLMFQKFDATGVTVEKVGFIEILDVNVNADALGESTITFNCFFQK